MKTSEHYESDILFFFDGKPAELALYQAFFRRMEAAFPDASVRVQKSQISFYGKHFFAAASLPLRPPEGLAEGVYSGDLRPPDPPGLPPDRRGGGALPPTAGPTTS